MTTRLSLAGAACALLLLAPATGAQAPDALVAARPAAPATVLPPATPGDPGGAPTPPRAVAALPRPNETVVVRGPAWGRPTVRGALVGTGVGLVVGVLAYRNNQRKCEDCVGNDAIPVLVTGAGTVLGAAVGLLAHVARGDTAPAR